MTVIFGKMLANFLGIETILNVQYSSFCGVYYPIANQIIRKYIFQEYARITPIEPFSLYVCLVPTVDSDDTPENCFFQISSYPRPRAKSPWRTSPGLMAEEGGKGVERSLGQFTNDLSKKTSKVSYSSCAIYNLVKQQC